MQATYQLVRVFDNPNGAQGNQAAIIFDHDLSNISSSTYKQHDVATTCFISQVNKEHYDVRCFNGSYEIQCCGHGLIAAAKSIFSIQNFSKITINKNVTASHCIDEAGHNVVSLNLPRLLAQSKPITNWMNQVIDFYGEKLIPNKAAVSEDNDGYLLLEFKPALPLEVFRGMKIDLKKVCENTQRAIVVVQFDKKNKHLYTRYFAPQYGVSEDIATGSVMRFVGDYIEKTYKTKYFDVSQCSLQGGFMKIECKADNVIITANASMETN